MAHTVQFLFDFGSPNAFLSHEAIPAIAARTGATFDYVPVLLGGIFKATNNRSPAETLAGVKCTLAYDDDNVGAFVRSVRQRAGAQRAAPAIRRRRLDPEERAKQSGMV